MKRVSWEVRFGLFLALLSLILYFIHYAIFKNIQHIYLWSMTSLAFLPISVLVVTMIINRLMVNREKRSKLDKLNMLIGVFFSEVGRTLLVYFSDWDPQLDMIRKSLVITGDWSFKKFAEISKRLRRHDYSVEIQKVDLAHLCSFLKEKRDFLLRMLENPNLLEHESFTALLRAAFHLAEELENRLDIRNLPESDYQHLAGDIKRVYTLIVGEWLDYMRYLKYNYPYLFSLAMRTNPFDENASVVVGK